MDITKDIEKFKEVCERLFNSTEPKVNKDEARAGVLGYHPLALLVVALDYIEELNKVPNKETLIAMLEAETGVNLKKFDTVEEMIKELDRPE